MATLDPPLISSMYPGMLKSNLLKLTASSRELKSVGNLASYRNLSRLDLSKNCLESVKGLSDNSPITWLSVANNELKSLEEISGLTNLQVLNAGSNQLSGTVELDSLSHLKALILNNNKIKGIAGLGGMKELNSLIISHNRIKDLGKVLKGCTALTKLSMSHNRVEDLSGKALRDCTKLFELKAGHNAIKELPSEFKSCYRLRILDLAGNMIPNVEAIKVLQELKYLRHLVLKGNPIVAVPGYWETVVDLLPNLESLDGRKVEGRSHKKQPEKKAGHNKQLDEEDVVDAAELGLSSAAGPDEADRSFATEMMESAAEEKVAAGGKKTGVVAVISAKKRKRGGKKDDDAEKPVGKSVADLLLAGAQEKDETSKVGMGGSSAWGSTDAASTPAAGTKADVKTPKSAKKSKKKEKSV